MKQIVRVFRELLLLLRNWRLYVGACVLFAGIQLNFAMQVYLHNCITRGDTLPELSDIILDNIPKYDIAVLSDLGGVAAFLVFLAYVIHRDRVRLVPYYLLLCGAYNLVRAVFVVLTPLGNPPHFVGTDGPFHAFSKFELGVYPSGHTGITFMYFVLAQDRWYRVGLMACLLVVIGSLFLSRSHYSIDVLSGIFFAYAIRSYGEKYWGGMKLPPDALDVGEG